MKIISKFVKLHLSSQIFIILSVLMISNIIIFVSLYQYTLQLYTKQIHEQTKQIISTLQSSIDREISMGVDKAVVISHNKAINECIKTLSDDNAYFSERFQASQQLESNRQNYLNFNNYITSVQFYDSNGNRISSGSDSLISEELKKIEPKLLNSSSPCDYVAFPGERLVIFQKIYDLYDVTQSNIIGAVSICYNIRKMIDDMNIIDSKSHKLNLRFNNTPIYTMLNTNIDTSYLPQIIDVNDIQYCCMSLNSQLTEITYTVYYKVSHSNNPIKSIALLTLFCAAIILILFFGTVLFLTFVMLLPLNKLYNNVVKYSSYNSNSIYTFDSDTSTSNELHILATKCFKLIQEINESEKKHLKVKSELVKTELEMLYTQINPHFLYNTLDSIYWLSLPHDHRIADMTKSLSDMFRIVTNNEEFMVTISKELSILALYLNIQNHRFSKRLKVAVNCDKSLYEIMIPKLTVQPFVENSIKYILEKVNDVCIIDINIYKTLNQLHIEIIDNGPEIVKDYSNQLLSNQKTGVGISNVSRRLELEYGTKSKIDFFIKDNKFVVSILIEDID